MTITGQTVRWSMAGMILLGVVACDTKTTGPDVPTAASKLTSGGKGSREVELTATDFNAAGSLIVRRCADDRWAVTALGIGHITISLRREAPGRPWALNSSVHGDVAPIAPEDAWIGIPVTQA
jgi:hypothetical protein